MDTVRIQKALDAMKSVAPIVGHYLKREITAPANHQEFQQEAANKLWKFNNALDELETALAAYSSSETGVPDELEIQEFGSHCAAKVQNLLTDRYTNSQKLVGGIIAQELRMWLQQAAAAPAEEMRAALIDIKTNWWDKHYTADVFDGSSGDDGALEIVRLRNVINSALGAAPKETASRKVYPCGTEATGSDNLPKSCPVHGDNCTPLSAVLSNEKYSEESTKLAREAADAARKEIAPQGKHICCWERENPHRCILCCQCGKKFVPREDRQS